jgi:hypothetical protein
MMSRTLMALIMKYIMTYAIAWIALSVMDTNPIGTVAVVALVAAAANYLIGDLLILPTFGNVIASIADGLTGALVVLAANVVGYLPSVNAGSLLILGILVAIGEFFFHRYLEQSEEVAP